MDGTIKSLNVMISSSEPHCRGNSVLSSQIYNYLTYNEHRIVNSIEKADFFIINTCGVDEFHERYSYEQINYINKKKPKSRIIIMGCLGKINPDELNKFENVQIINNPQDLDQIFFKKEKFSDKFQYLNEKIFEKLRFDKQRRVTQKYPIELRIAKLLIKFIEIMNKVFSAAGFNNAKLQAFLNEELMSDKFLVRISRGCLSNCSYCIIKRATGKLHSRTLSEIMNDIQENMKDEKTIFLISDDCGCYGLDIGSNLFELIEKINFKYPNHQIDFNFLNPNWLVKYRLKYLEIIKRIKLGYLCIPIQSASNKILKKMNRNDDIDIIYNITKQIRKNKPKLLLSTNYMVGFPGETMLDYFKTLFYIRTFDFGYTGMYSARKGSPSYEFPNQIPDLIKKLRFIILNAFILVNFIINTILVEMHK